MTSCTEREPYRTLRQTNGANTEARPLPPTQIMLSYWYLPKEITHLWDLIYALKKAILVNLRKIIVRPESEAEITEQKCDEKPNQTVTGRCRTMLVLLLLTVKELLSSKRSQFIFIQSKFGISVGRYLFLSHRCRSGILSPVKSPLLWRAVCCIVVKSLL